MTLTYEKFRAIVPSLDEMRAQIYFPYLKDAMNEGQINTPLREAHFLAQLCHESGCLRYFSELWGPTDAQKNYEPPSTKAHELGNDEQGDGYKYRGRGPIQLTGKANYRIAGEALGLDLVDRPELATHPANAFRIAVWFWTKHDLNALADADDLKAITKKINGGYNGLASRQRYFDHAKAILGVK